MEIYVVGVIVWAYFCFTFAAEQMHPFAEPEIYVQRTQWQYGRRIGALALGFGVLFLLMMQFAHLAPHTALLSCLSLFAASWLLQARRSHSAGAI